MTKTIFCIIIAILSLVGMFVTAHQMDKEEILNTTFNAFCVGSIAVYGIILGLCLGLLFG